MRRAGVAPFVLLAAACGAVVRPAPLVSPLAPAGAVRADGAFVLPPAEAYARGLMPLASTGVLNFRRAHPTWDGRGVLIAILDSGIDPGVPGLALATTGEPKLLELRDFSGEGRVPLTRIAPAGDSVSFGGRTLGGFSRVLTVNGVGPWYAGVVRELSLGDGPAADLNWNGVVGDTLLVVVTRASDGWVLFADTDGDGSLRNEHPIHDYQLARETFGWAPPGHAPALHLAVNLREQRGEPVLDLFFDTSGHGTHVAGIAAGHDLYGIPGFDGVAPGAQVIGLKIADDAHGAISTTGAMLQALDYAITFAAARQMPLVINLSFGVGNEREGTARIDRLFDSVLALHPGVTFTISAGNDGPGLSTLGFPGSASRAISVGATLPRPFFARDPGADVLAYFSSRGGEIAKPDLVTPGVAFSTVPAWHRGMEVLQGTSMAAPHAAGLVALLVSALTERREPIEARRLRQALMVTAQPLAGFTVLDQGSGVPDVGRAWTWLARRFPYPEITAETGAPLGGSGNAALRPAALASAGDTLQQFTLHRAGSDTAPLILTFRSDTSWVVAPPPMTFSGSSTTVTLRYRAGEIGAPGLHVGEVTTWGPDTLAGPLVRLVNAVVVPGPVDVPLDERPTPLAAGTERRWYFRADSARPFEVQVATAGSREVVGAFLYEPGGMPFRGGHELEGSAGNEAAMFRVDARDVIPGVYEVDAVAPPATLSSAGIQLRRAPFTLSGVRDRQGVDVRVRNVTEVPVTAMLGARLVGTQRIVYVVQRGSAPVVVPFQAPPWAKSVQVDFQMERSQWGRFTDFGVTLFDADGHQLGQSPLNYAIGRMAAALPHRVDPGMVHLTLFPAFADPADTAAWLGTLTIRLYAPDDSALRLVPADSVRAMIAPGADGDARFLFPRNAWTPGDAFVPLGVVTAQVEGAGATWTRELPLPTPSLPLMR
ncbi:MAG: S8 family serine peptidase [Gemmatimonadales bacterium]